MTKLGLGLVGLLSLALGGLALHPGLDLDAARVFYAGNHRFVGDTPIGVAVRYIAWVFPYFVYAALLFVWSLKRTRLIAARWAPSGRSLLVLTLSLAIGPGLLINWVKLTAHRPRPSDVTQFGGSDRFRAFTQFDGACQRSCSFPSAETASATWMLAPASLVPPPWRGAALAGAVVFAAATGAWRMAFGGHFLSDVTGAALITVLTILACRAWLRPGETPK